GAAGRRAVQRPAQPGRRRRTADLRDQPPVLLHRAADRGRRGGRDRRAAGAGGGRRPPAARRVAGGRRDGPPLGRRVHRRGEVLRVRHLPGRLRARPGVRGAGDRAGGPVSRRRLRLDTLATALTGAVLEVGVLLREWRSDAGATSGVWEGSQFKAEADAMAHGALSDRLRALEPGVPVLSEEDSASLVADRPDVHWMIDPIDGTASFVHGYPGYVTQAALMEGGVPVVSAIYAPENDVMYAAVRGVGATRNGDHLPRLSPAPVGTGALIDNTPEPRGIALAV